MKQTKHTPGPWKVTFNLAATHAPYDMVVATFDCMGQHKHIICTDVTTPNAHLIAAAPELLAVLRDIAQQKPSEWQGGFMEWAQGIAETAIAKAEGN